MIDLRSDTVTRPTSAMRQAMFQAEVGDDVYQEDPTVNHLERRAAEIFGKEAALFVPTGTMGNTIGIKCLTEPGQEVIAEARGHLLNYELSMTAWFSGCQIRTIDAPDGILTWAAVRQAYRPLGPHWAPTGCLALENTHNMAGGTVYPMGTLQEIFAESRKLRLRIHLDGARVFNAAMVVGCTVKEIAACADTVMFCLSKGLGAPAGSMLVGPADLLARARLYRKRLGGGMRQAGILAAAGLIALEEMPQRLGIDHQNARVLATGLAQIPGITLDAAGVATNIVIFDVSATGLLAPQISAELKQRGVLLNAINATTLRAVTHYDIDEADCATAMEAVSQVVLRR